MSKTLKTEAIVLRKRSLLSKDSLVTLFSKDLGKINVFAKGAKKITSRRLPHIQTANLINVVISQKGDRFYLQETSLISAFSQIKKNHAKIQSLYLFFFVLERLLPEHQIENDPYIALKSFLITLSDRQDNNTQILTKYLNKILQFFGYLKEKKTLDELTPFIQEIIREKIPRLHI